jgi:arabinose-5-phosphate isomerase
MNAPHTPPQHLLQLARQVLDIEADAVRNLSLRLDERFADAVQLMLACRGRVVVSGMGKSGHIGHKIAATLASPARRRFSCTPERPVMVTSA